MKNIYLIIFLICISVSNQAQESQRGRIKTSLSGIPVFDLDNGFYGFAVKPGLEYFILDNFSIQNDFFYHAKLDFDVAGVQSNSKTFGFIPSIRYNHFFKNKLNIFGQIGIGFGSVIYKPLEDQTTYNVEQLNSGVVVYSAGVGICYQFSGFFEVELLIPYMLVDNVTNDANADILFNGVGPTIGMKFSLNNK